MSTKPADELVSKHFTTPVDRYLLVCIYLMVLTGFGTLAATGQLDLASVLFVTGALAWRGYLLLVRQSVVVPESWSTRLALGFVLLYLVDVLLVSRSFLTATVHLVMCGLVVKIFSPLRDRDYILLSALSFAMVLAASAMTVDSAFFLMFCVFLLMAVGTFILLQMRRSAATATAWPIGEEGRLLERRLGVSLGTITPVILLLILAGAAGIFFLLPRVSSGYAGALSAGNDFSTGFSDAVRLGSIGEIQQSQAVVMHVKIESGILPADLRWRGVTLSRFDGKIWSNPAGNQPARRLPDGSFLVAPALPTSDHNTLRYKVLLEPISSNIFFLAEQPLLVFGGYRALGIDAGGAVLDLDHEHPIAVYEGESDSTRPSPVELRAGIADSGAGVSPAYLEVPGLEPRIAQLARDITAGASNDYDRAVALEDYLRTHYGYTLQLPTTTPKDPVANFLFDRKQGHCEYFASAMAVMLRSLGIPSRLVNGFRGGELNEYSGQYIVRARDAHSWVEAYMPGHGWVSFDPTPAASSLPTGAWSRIGLYVDAMTVFWREWVVNYDFARQRSLGEEGARRGRALLEGLREHAMAQYQKLIRAAKAASQRSPGTPGALLLGGATLLALLLALANTARLLRWSRALVWRRRPASAPRLAASLWYGRVTKTLRKRGWHKREDQTATEFVEVISDVRIRQAVGRFTLHYERARFAESAEDAQLLPELYAKVTANPRQRR